MVTRDHSGSRLRCDDERLAALPDAGLPDARSLRLLPGQRGLRFRDQLQDSMAVVAGRSRSSLASTCCAQRAVSSSREMSSTGGCRRRDRGCAPGSPTTSCGWPTPPPATSRSPATWRCSTSRWASSAGRCSSRESTSGSSNPTRGGARPRSTSTASWHSTAPADRGPHDLPLIGTGDWNDGMNRVGAAGRGESVWLGWFLHATLDDFLPLARARGDHEVVARWRLQQQSLVRSPRDAPDGTVGGTGAATSTTALRSARPRARSAASTPSRRAGLRSPAPPPTTGRTRHGGARP